MRGLIVGLLVVSCGGCSNARTVGSGTYGLDQGSLAEKPTPVAVWANAAFRTGGIGGSATLDDSGGWQILFATASTDTACTDAAMLELRDSLDIRTAPAPIPVLTPGPITVVGSATISGSPTSLPIAAFHALDPDQASGTVTITAFDADTITGTFSATGAAASGPVAGAPTITGTFAAAICVD